MFGAVDVVIAQSMTVHGAFDPWLVLLWLAAMAGFLVVVAAVVAVVEFVAGLRRRRVGRLAHPAKRIEA